MEKISYKDFATLAGYTKPHYFMRLACNFYMQDGIMVHLWAKMKLVWYILLFIPCHIAELFYVLWDGGLREFEIASRWITTYYVDKNSERYTNWKGE